MQDDLNYFSILFQISILFQLKDFYVGIQRLNFLKFEIEYLIRRIYYLISKKIDIINFYFVSVS